jgi:hypothetical protein
MYRAHHGYALSDLYHTTTKSNLPPVRSRVCFVTSYRIDLTMGLVIPARQIRPSFPPRSRDHHAKSRRNRATGSDHQKHGETLFHRPPPPLLAVVPGPRERNAFCVIEGGKRNVSPDNDDRRRGDAAVSASSRSGETHPLYCPHHNNKRFAFIPRAPATLRELPIIFHHHRRGRPFIFPARPRIL